MSLPNYEKNSNEMKKLNYEEKIINLRGNNVDSGTMYLYINRATKIAHFVFTVNTHSYELATGTFYTELTPVSSINEHFIFSISKNIVGFAELREDGGIRIYCNNSSGTFTGTGTFMFK